MRESRRYLLAALVAELLLLVPTGVYLVFRYRPKPVNAWNDIEALRGHGPYLTDVIRALHDWSSFLLLWTAIALAAVAVVDEVRRRRFRIVAGVAALPFVAALASFTGYLLPWDQLALWAVTVGSNYGGYGPIWGHKARYVLLGGTEVSSDTLLRWFIVHTIVLAPLFAALLYAAWRGLRHVDAAPEVAAPH